MVLRFVLFADVACGVVKTWIHFLDTGREHGARVKGCLLAVDRQGAYAAAEMFAVHLISRAREFECRALRCRISMDAEKRVIDRSTASRACFSAIV